MANVRLCSFISLLLLLNHYYLTSFSQQISSLIYLVYVSIAIIAQREWTNICPMKLSDSFVKNKPLEGLLLQCQYNIFCRCKKFVLQDSTDTCIKDLHMKHLESDPEHIRAKTLEEIEKVNNQSKRYALLEKLLKEQSSLLKGIVEESKQDPSKC